MKTMLPESCSCVALRNVMIGMEAMDAHLLCIPMKHKNYINLVNP